MFNIEKEKISTDTQAFILSRKPEEVYNALEIGILVMNKVQMNSDLDFVKNQIDKLNFRA